MAALGSASHDGGQTVGCLAENRLQRIVRRSLRGEHRGLALHQLAYIRPAKLATFATSGVADPTSVAICSTR